MMNIFKLLTGWAFYIFIVFGFGSTLEDSSNLESGMFVSIIFLYFGSLLIYFNDIKLKNLKLSQLEQISKKSKRITSLIILTITSIGFIFLLASDNMEPGGVVIFLLLWVIGWRLFYRHKTALKLINSNITAETAQMSKIESSTAALKELSNFQKLLLSVVVSVFIMIFAKMFIGINNSYILILMFIFTLIVLTLQLVPIGELNIKLKEV